MNEVNVETIEFGDEVRQSVQFRLALAPIVIRPLIAREVLHSRELHALCGIGDRFSFRPIGRVDPPAQFGKLRLWNIHLRKRTNGICLLATSLCSNSLGHGVLFLSSFEFLEFPVNMRIRGCIGVANGDVILGRTDEYFFAITAPCEAKTPSDFCREPLPSRRSGKMLEETRLDYALVTVFVEVWISIGSCRRLLEEDGQPGSYRFVFRVSTDKRASRLLLIS